MNAKRLIGAAAALLAFSPLAAFAGGGDQDSKQWLATLKSTRSVQEVRAEARQAKDYGQLHPVEVQVSSGSAVSRAEVRADLAKYGVRAVGA